jgi:hypothetical protein
MLNQLNSNQYTIYTVQTRGKKNDAYEDSKIDRDRFKLRRWVEALLADREVIMFWTEEDTDYMMVGTTKVNPGEGFAELPKDLPTIKCNVNGKEVDEPQFITFHCVPGREIATVDVDHITKFIVSIEGLVELTQKVLREEANGS